MKRFFKLYFCLAICAMLFACTPDDSRGILTSTPAATATALNENSIQPTSTLLSASSLPTFPAAPTPTPMTPLPLPTLSFDAVPTVVFDTTPFAEVPTAGIPATPSIDQMQQPYFEQTAIPGLLQSHLTLETLPAFRGHDLQRISGWKYGFGRLEWMDANHLLFYPVAGIYSIGGGSAPGVYPAVASLDSNTFWFPLPNRWGGERYPALPRWSRRLGVLVAAASDTSTAVYSPDGKVRKVYEGKFQGISPSATKLLIDDTWIDLGSGKQVRFAWSQTGMAAQYASYAQFHPIWSPDEMRVYSCCYVFGDVRTGESFVLPYSGVPVEGDKEERAWLEAHRGTWVLKDKYLLPIWEGVWDGRPDWVSLFDPATKSYRNLSAAMGIPYSFANPPEPYCNRPSAQNGGRYVWVACRDGGHLVDLATFHSQAYPPVEDGSPFGWLVFADLEWSADGNFAWLHGDRDGIERILSASGKELKIPPVITEKVWHPVESKLTYLSDDGRTLLMLDPQTASVQREISLPVEFYKFAWSADGKQIAFVAYDHSVWRADYPRLDHFEQLTPPLSQLIAPGDGKTHIGDLVWSSNNTALAFTGTGGIYTVRLSSTP